MPDSRAQTVVPDVLTFCRARNQTRCRYAGRCCSPLGETLDQAFCQSFLDASCPKAPTGAVVFDPVAAARCVDAERDAMQLDACATPRLDSAAGQAAAKACGKVFLPTLVAGELCWRSDECIAGEGFVGYCPPYGTDGAPPPRCTTTKAANGTPDDLASAGSVCGADADCASGNCIWMIPSRQCGADAKPAFGASDCRDLGFAQTYGILNVAIQSGLEEIAVDETHVYWSVGRRIWRVLKSGGTEPEFVFEDRENIGSGNGFFQIAVTGDAIYGLRGSGIVRIGKLDGVATTGPVSLPGRNIWVFAADGIWVSSDCRTLEKYSFSLDLQSTVAGPDPGSDAMAADLAIGDHDRVFCATRSAISMFDPTISGAALPIAAPPPAPITNLFPDGERLWVFVSPQPYENASIYAIDLTAPAGTAALATTVSPRAWGTLFDKSRRRFYWIDDTTPRLMMASLPDLAPISIVSGIHIGSWFGMDDASLYLSVAGKAPGSTIAGLSIVKFPAP